MKQHSLIRSAQAQSVADLLGVPAFDVAQQEDGPLPLGEPFARRLDRRRGLAVQQALLGDPSQLHEKVDQQFAHRGCEPSKKRFSSGSGLSPSASKRASSEKGTLRASRSARLRAQFVTITNSQLFKAERPSKPSRPRRQRTQASCTVSSAAWRLRT